MKAIILSAGQGSRLGHLTADRPKCLIDFGGRTLLDRQLDTLAANGVDDVVVVTGFRDDQVESAIARRAGGPKIRTIYNPFYKVADNLGSLFIARHELAGDCLVWNGDTLVSPALMRRVIANDRPGICVTIDRKAEGDVYPIVLLSYAIACEKYEDPQVAARVKAYLSYIGSAEGQQAAADKVGNAPLSAELSGRVEASANSIS